MAEISQNIDNEFLGGILASTKEEFTQAIKKVPVDLLEGEERLAYTFILDYYKKSKGELPSKTALSLKFPQLKLTRPQDALSYYIDELYGRRKYQLFTTYLATMQNQLFSMDLAKAEKSLQDLRIGLSEVQMADSETVDASLEERIALYERTKANEGVIGVQTGFEFFDKVVGGIRTEYIGIIGTSGVGKTYFFLRVAMNYAAQVDGCILIVTNEMSVEDISTRCDSIVGEFSATKYREGRLNAEEESRLRQLSSLYTQMGKVHVISGAGKSIDDIELEMIRLEPAAVFIDGVYLSVETGKDLFKDTMIASRKIQALTKKYKTPFIGTFQFNADGDIAYAKSVRQDVDILLKIYQSQAMLMNVPPLMGFEFLKTRMARNGAKGLNVWDFENWNFEEIPENEGGQYTEDSFNG